MNAAIVESLKHLGLEPWHDGRSILDGKRPEDQHVMMIVSSLKAERDAAILQISDLREAVRVEQGLLQDEIERREAIERLNDDLKKWIRLSGHNHEGGDSQDWDDCALCLLNKQEKRVVPVPKKCGKISLKFDECQLDPGHKGRHQGNETAWDGDE